MSRIYLDHNASAPLDLAVRAAIGDALDTVGNPSSPHREGARARSLVERAREQVAALLGAQPREIVFTSGATEANDLAIRGVVALRPGVVVATAIEHASVLASARAVAADRLRLVPVDADGRVSADAVAAAADAETALVTVGLANGEVGSVAPVAEIARRLRGRGFAIHTDAAQAAGRLRVDVGALGVDLLSLSAHKLGGPTGVGALWIRAEFDLVPVLHGGSQERGRRAGTENVAGIVGFGVAAERARRELETRIAQMTSQRARLHAKISAALPDAIWNGPVDGPCLPNTLNVIFPGVAGESLLVLLDLAGVAASLGSACAAGGVEPSHVLRAMGRTVDQARNGLRLSLGPATTAAEIDAVADLLPRLVADVRRRAA